MKVPLSWLKKFVPKASSPRKVAERLTMGGIEVEEVIDYGKVYDKIVVGEIVHIRPHPAADKLRLAFVATEKDGKPLEVVCGAPNIAIGQKVAFAKVGAHLPNGMVMEERPIRGVVSHGMICSEDELDLGKAHDKTMELDLSLTPGTPFARVIGLDDVVLDVSVPANRSDLMSVRGIAWEAAALMGLPFRSKAMLPSESTVPASRSVRVRIALPKLCPRYTARVIRGIRVVPSPAWLQYILLLAGIRPINAVVDATNYVMLEYGQPLHAFDAKALSGNGITVRTAVKGERVTTLDSIERNLDPSVLVIADEKGPIALAGVMGCKHSEISERTTDIILESAIFDPVSIRRTSRKLGLSSEASLRFEKGLPLRLQEQASSAAAALIAELCGGTVERGIVSAGTRKPRKTVIAVKPETFSEVLGTQVSEASARRALERLGFIVSGTKASWKVAVPYWRLDVQLPADLIDEVGRSIGYERLPEILPQMEFIPKPLPELIKLKDDIIDVLVGFGFTETISHAYYGKPWARQIGGPHYEIQNPLDASQEFLRKSLLPQLHSIVRAAVKAGSDARVFQIGRVFVPTEGKPIEQQQPWKLAIGMAFKPKPGYCNGRKIIGVLDELFRALGILSMVTKNTEPVIDMTTYPGRVVEWIEIDIASMRDNFAPLMANPLPKYPAVYRDISLWIPLTVTYHVVDEMIRQSGKPLLESAELFDVFEKENRRSLAFHLTFRSKERTLTEDEILAKMKVITGKLKSLGAELR
ncbi:MAG: phenylalanine--tRNA ligase subunit beta [Candidatus Kerfeldbacteria bacterium]